MNIYSVGCTPEVAIRALCDSRRVRFGGKLEPLADYQGTTYEWGFRFIAGGRPRKAAGIMVPGGASGAKAVDNPLTPRFSVLL